MATLKEDRLPDITIMPKDGVSQSLKDAIAEVRSEAPGTPSDPEPASAADPFEQQKQRCQEIARYIREINEGKESDPNRHRGFLRKLDQLISELGQLKGKEDIAADDVQDITTGLSQMDTYRAFLTEKIAEAERPAAHGSTPPADADEMDPEASRQINAIKSDLRAALRQAHENDRNFATSSVQLDQITHPFYQALVAEYDRRNGRSSRAQELLNMKAARQDFNEEVSKYLTRHSVRAEGAVRPQTPQPLPEQEMTPAELAWEAIETKIESLRDQIAAMLKEKIAADPGYVTYDPKDVEDLVAMGVKYELRELVKRAKARFETAGKKG